MRKSKLEAAQTREAIVTAAADLIRRTGIAEASLADMMAAAGLTHGGFYRHFRNSSIASMFSQEVERFDSQQLGRAPARQAVLRSCNGFLSQQAFIQCAQTLAKQRVAQRIPEQGRG